MDDEINLRSEYFGVHFSEFSLDEINREFMKRVRKEEPKKKKEKEKP